MVKPSRTQTGAPSELPRTSPKSEVSSASPLRIAGPCSLLSGGRPGAAAPEFGSRRAVELPSYSATGPVTDPESGSRRAVELSSYSATGLVTGPESGSRRVGRTPQLLGNRASHKPGVRQPTGRPDSLATRQRRSPSSRPRTAEYGLPSRIVSAPPSRALSTHGSQYRSPPRSV